MRDRLCLGAARGLSRLGQHDSRRTGALAGLARDRRPRGPARRRPRVDGRLRRGAQERHGHRSDAGQDRAVAWHPLRSRHRHAGTTGRRRLRVDEERRGQRRRLHRPPRRASGFERPGIRCARHADQQHGGRAGGLQPELETIASASRPGRHQGGPGRAAAAAVGLRHRARGASRRQHRESASHGPANRPAHDERAVARHVRRLCDADVESDGQRQGSARHVRAVRVAPLRRVVRAADRPVAGPARG